MEDVNSSEEIMKRLRRIDFQDIYYSDEDYFVKSPMNHHHLAMNVGLLDMHRRSASEWFRGRDPIERRDLGDVKYYEPSKLEEITEGFSNKNFLSRTLFGRLFRGKIHQGSESRDVLVKTWDFYFPVKGMYEDHPARLVDEIEFVSEESKGTENLVKIVGYCFEKKLALVYNLKPKGLLRDELCSLTFSWESRIELAFKLARILRSLHDKSIILGAIDASHILIDEEYNMSLFEFGVLAKLEKGNYNTFSKDLIGIYLRHCHDCMFSGLWYMKSDVYAFGVLLMELIRGCEFDKSRHHDIISKIWSDFQQQEVSLVNADLNQDADTCGLVTRLAVSCIAPNPDDRPDMGFVADNLKPFLKLNQLEAKRQKTEA
ncbi:hypothetical protein ACH5RR_014756 [Cinchona calisaya]|uniref:Protein kinase domain-containing protein n=1 Tax=Cinchona calisaya TaxID=153742 RepID=A0ABD2ZR73_9GENT